MTIHAGKFLRDAPLRKRALFIFLMGGMIPLLTAALIESAAQFYVLWIVTPAFEQAKEHGGHYYRRSKNPRLGYELQPGYERQVDGRHLNINRFGFRGGETKQRNRSYRLALLGDSVTFGIGLTQEKTLSSIMEASMLCKDLEILNLGVPGYGVQEIDAQLKSKYQSVGFDVVIYLLNLNDFALRDTAYEGADNGLYRMYEMPTFKAPWLIRKSWYRLMKGGSIAAVVAAVVDPRAPNSAMKPDARWYRLLFNGTRDINLRTISEMKMFADKNGIKFGVFILPAGSAYNSGTYTLGDIHDQIVDYLTDHGVPVRDGVEMFMYAPELFFDETDHLLDRGNLAAAAAIISFFQAELGGRSTCGASNLPKPFRILSTSSPHAAEKGGDRWRRGHLRSRPRTPTRSWRNSA